MKNLSLRKIVTAGIFSALATLTFMLENLFPPIILPGARLGLSNVFILLSVLTLGAKFGFAVLIVKTVIGSLFAGNISAVMYSLPAGVISLTLEVLLLYFTKKTSLLAISVLGSVANITIQNATFCLITNAIEYMCYLPYLSLIGVISGLAVGFIVYLSLKFLPLNLLKEKVVEE